MFYNEDAFLGGSLARGGNKTADFCLFRLCVIDTWRIMPGWICVEFSLYRMGTGKSAASWVWWEVFVYCFVKMVGMGKTS